MVCVVNMYRVYKAYFTQVYRNPDVYIYVKNFTVSLCIRCLFYIGITAIYSWAEFYCLCAWDAHFYVGMSTLIVKTGKILLFAWDAYFHSGMPIFTVKLGTRMPIFT